MNNRENFTDKPGDGFRKGCSTNFGFMFFVVMIIATAVFYLLSAFALFFPEIQLIFTFYIPGIDKNFGARPLRRTIQSVLEDKLAEEILDGKLEIENDQTI